MYEQIEKPKEKKSRAVASAVAQKKNDCNSTFQFVDNRPQILVQRQIQDASLQKQPAYLTQSTSGTVIQAALNQESVQEAMNLLGLQESKVIEVPNRAEINALTPFSDYPEGFTYGLTESDLNQSIATINFGDQAEEYAEASAYDVLSLCGGAGYVHGLSFVSEGMDNYQRCLTHELGHHKQNVTSGYTFENTSVMLLEYHNVLLNENLFGPPFRVCYTQDNTASWCRSWDTADDKSTLIENFEGQAANALNSLHGIVASSSKLNDVSVYREIMSKLEELKTGLDVGDLDFRFVLVRFIWNLAKEAGPKIS